MACSASLVLDQVEYEPQSAAAKRGSLIHAVIAARLLGQSDPDVGRHRLPVSAKTINDLVVYLGEGEVHIEEAYSYDGERVEVLGNDIGRNYNRPNAINGAADIVVVRDEALCVDIKAGDLPVPDPSQNAQLAALSLFVSMAYPVKSVTAAIAKLNRDGSWFFSSCVYSLDNLAEFRWRLDGKRREWQDAEALQLSGWGVEPAPGPHCRFCKVKPEACAYAAANAYPVAHAV
jgi:hypothetical protein